MTIGAFVVSRDDDRLLPVVIRNLQQVADKVLIYVDSRTVDASLEVALACGAKVATGCLEPMPEGVFNECVRLLNTDWILHLDQDELLGPWLIERIPRMVKTEAAWRFPRYAVYPTEGQYITSDPYYPDYQTRLIPRKIWDEQGGWPARIHASPSWPFHHATAGLFHYKFLIYSRAEREARLAQWGASWPEALNAHYSAFSIYEGRELKTAPIPEPLPMQHFELREVAA